jgi:hypothetical protein
MTTIDMSRFMGASKVCALMVMSFLCAPGQAAEESQFSRANRLLFLTDHLANIRQPSVLHYAFEKSGTLEDSYQDNVDIKVTPEGATDAKSVEVRFFTGVRNQYVPPLSNAEGNPIVTTFLQREVGEMEGRTDGSWRYFQKVIKLALENDAKVKPVKFRYDGRVVQGTEITIQPYRDDPHRAEIAPYDSKYYTFILSDAVPGQVYRLGSVVPAKAEGPRGERVPLVEEVFQLSAIKSLSSAGAGE